MVRKKLTFEQQLDRFKRSDIRFMDFHGVRTPTSKTANIYPWFSFEIIQRINKKQATIVLFVGPAGVGKTHTALTIARSIDPKFDIDKQLVFTGKEFMDAVLNLKQGKIIVFDEPSYVVGKRDWYVQLNKAIVQVVESFRFKVHPLFIPIINRSLIDKTIRDHLVQYQVEVLQRGHAKVMQINPSLRVEKIYWNTRGELYVGLLDPTLCKLKRKKVNPKWTTSDWCPACPLFKDKSCDTMRARYERRRATIQEERYKETSDFIDEQLDRKDGVTGFQKTVDKALKMRDQLKNEKGKYDVGIIMYRMGIGRHNANNVKSILELEVDEKTGKTKKE